MLRSHRGIKGVSVVSFARVVAQVPSKTAWWLIGLSKAFRSCSDLSLRVAFRVAARGLPVRVPIASVDSCTASTVQESLHVCEVFTLPVRDGKLSSLKLAWIFLVCDGVDTRRYPCVVC